MRLPYMTIPASRLLGFLKFDSYLLCSPSDSVMACGSDLDAASSEVTMRLAVTLYFPGLYPSEKTDPTDPYCCDKCGGDCMASTDQVPAALEHRLPDRHHRRLNPAVCALGA